MFSQPYSPSDALSAPQAEVVLRGAAQVNSSLGAQVFHLPCLLSESSRAHSTSVIHTVVLVVYAITSCLQEGLF